jgi:3-methyladenine DNA glycosylase/8-oxoguanine DNA glycosylase
MGGFAILGNLISWQASSTIIHSIMKAHLFPNNTEGKFTFRKIGPITKLLTDDRKSFVRPDCFDAQGEWSRLLQDQDDLLAIKVNTAGVVSWSSSGDHDSASVKKIIKKLITPINLPQDAMAHLPKTLVTNFQRFAPLVHISSASIEEALFKSIIRQVITAKQAKQIIHRFVTEFGKCYEYEGVICYCFPSASDVAEISLERLISCGLGFKAKRLKTIAKKILDDGLEISSSVTDNLNTLKELKGIGEWTARSSLCDFIGDWSIYPVDDLAVRTWAYRMWPEYPWPRDAEEFQHEWENVNGQYVSQITFYLLTVASLLA